jgi:uncharacterized membrane protein YdbT with pleckstrin-like domain
MENNLLPNETIVQKAKLHWSIYIFGIVLIVLALFSSDWAVKFWCGFFGIIMLVRAYLYMKSTEFVVTNMRMLIKTGFIKRTMFEMRHEKVEGILMNQGIFDRIFDKGTLTVNGTGGTRARVRNVCAPLQFRMQAMEAIGQKS